VSDAFQIAAPRCRHRVLEHDLDPADGVTQVVVL